MSGAYYNEIDPGAAQWLRNLINAGLIAAGEVDERSIEDIRPDEIRGFTQVHFFAGIGVWSYALRRAGWDDTRPVWTGSCPCQPFSAAGKGNGFADERHLWPAWFHLINELRPSAIFGEQVASKDADPWIDLVQTDLEAVGYAVGAIPFPSAGIGAPHIRDRLYWVADANQEQRGWRADGEKRIAHRPQAGWEQSNRFAEHDCAPGGMGNANHAGLEGFGSGHQATRGRIGAVRPVAAPGESGGLANSASSGRREEHADAGRSLAGSGAQGVATGLVHGIVHGGMADDASERWSGRAADTGKSTGRHGTENSGSADSPGPTNGFWSAADWLGCRDGKWRPVSPKPQPMVDGSAESLGRVRADTIDKIEEEINAWSMESQIDGNTALRDLLGHLGAQAQRCWEAGRIPRLHEAPFLLAFVRQLTEQGWRVAQCLPVSCEEVNQAVLRGMRDDDGQAGVSRQRGLEGQPAGERADPMSFLSSLLARHALEAWDSAYAAYAEIGFPLAHGARSRVIRLRAYGNAINAEAAQAMIEAYLQTEQARDKLAGQLLEQAA